MLNDVFKISNHVNKIIDISDSEKFYQLAKNSRN